MALLDTQVAVLANQAMNYLFRSPPRRLGNAHPNIVPYQVFATRDGPIIIAAGNDGQFARLCDLLGLGQLAADARFMTNPARVANRHALLDEIEPAIADRTSAALLAQLEQAGIPAGPVNRLDQVFADPQVIARQMRRELLLPSGDTVPTVRGPIVMDGQACTADSASPRLGEHTGEVLQKLAEGRDPWAECAKIAE